jgi:hypothetical protein
MTPNARTPWPPLLALTLAAALATGCYGGGPDRTGGTGDDAGTGDDTGTGLDAGVDSHTEDAATNLGWGGNTNIEEIFETSCSGCHGSQWSSCWNVQDSASEVEGEVSSGDMPRGGTLAPADKSALVAWLNAGAQCSGAQPDGGVGGGGGVPSFPVLSGEVVVTLTP